MPKSWIALVLLFAVAACAPYKKVDSGHVALGGLNVETGQAWSQVSTEFLPDRGPTAVWTADGLPLNQILFYSAVADGQPLFKAKDEERPYAPFRADMLELDIQELLEDSLSRFYNTGPIATQSIAPRTFAGAPGFEMQFGFAAKGNDLEYRAVASGAVIDGKLYLMVFTAPRIHYFDAYAGEVDRMVSSATVTGI